MYNKRQFTKANDKKTLRKVGKQWKTVSVALLMALGGAAVATHVNASADTANQNHNQTTVTNQNQTSSGSTLVKPANHDQSAQSSAVAQSGMSQSAIASQAGALHNQILQNHLHQTPSAAQSNVAKATQLPSSSTATVSATSVGNSDAGWMDPDYSDPNAPSNHTGILSDSSLPFTPSQIPVANDIVWYDETNPKNRGGLGVVPMASDWLTGQSDTTGHLDAPYGYHYPSVLNGNVITTDGDFTYSSSEKVHGFSVLPNSVDETVYFRNVYNNQVVSSQIMSGHYNQKGQTKAPYGYHFYNNNGSFKFGNNGTVNIYVAPDSVSSVVTYKYGNLPLGTQSFTGDYDQKFSLGWHPTNLNSNYYVVQPDREYFYGSNPQVQVHPNWENNSISFINDEDNRPVGSTSLSGWYGTNGKVSNLPSWYHLADGANATQIIDGGHSVLRVSPYSARDTVNYWYNGNRLATTHPSGDMYYAPGAVNATFKANDDNLPNGLLGRYHMVNNNQTIPYDDGQFNVNVLPNQATTRINYEYNGESEGTGYHHGNYGERFSLNWHPSGLSSNYYVVAPNQKYSNVNGALNVAVHPNWVKEPVNFRNTEDNRIVANGQTSNWYGNTNQVNAPSGYHFAGPSAVTVNNQLHTLSVTPNSAYDIVDFWNGGYHVGSHTYYGDINYAKGATNRTLTINNINLPGNLARFYHMKNANGQTFNYGNVHKNVQLVPNTANATLVYVLNGNPQSPVGTHLVSGNYGSTFPISSDPAGLNHAEYKVDNPNQTITYNNAKTLVSVSKKLATDRVVYLLNGRTRVGGDDRLTGPYGDNYPIGAQPLGLDTTKYRVNNPGQIATYNDSTVPVDVHYNQARAFVIYVLNGNPRNIVGHNAVSNNYGSTFPIGNDPAGLNHAEYSVDNPNQTITYNNDDTFVSVRKNQATDELIYRLNGNQVGSGYTSGAYADLSKIGTRPNGLNTTKYVVNNPNQLITYNNSKVVVAVRKNNATARVIYTLDGQKVGSDSVNGTYGDSFPISNDPTGLDNTEYSVNNPGQIITYNNANAFVAVHKNNAAAHLVYTLNGNRIGSQDVHGIYGNTFSIGTRPQGLNTAEYVVNNPNQVITYNNSTADIAVHLNQASVHMVYMLNGHQVGSNSASGTYGNHFQVSAHPNGLNTTKYVVNDPDQMITYNDSTVPVDVHYNQAHAFVTYVLNGNPRNVVGHNTVSNNYGSTFQIGNNPAGLNHAEYSVDNPNQTITYNDANAFVSVHQNPAFDNLVYVLNGHAVGSHRFNGLYGNTFKVSNQPAGLNNVEYSVNDPNQVVTYNDSTVPVNVHVNDVTDTIQILDATNGDRPISGLNDLKKTGPKGLSFNAKSLFPQSDQPIGSTIIKFDGGTHQIRVKPMSTANIIAFYKNRLGQVSVITRRSEPGVKGTAFRVNSNPGSIHAGFYALTNPLVTYNGGRYVFPVYWIKIYNTIKFRDQSTDNVLGQHAFNGPVRETGLPEVNHRASAFAKYLPSGYHIVNPNQIIQNNSIHNPNGVLYITVAKD